VRALNDLRKDAGFEIADRIDVALDAPADVQAALAPHADWIAGEVLAVSFAVGPFEAGANAVTCTTELDGRMLDVALTRV
jgi:isoleucyl-tRNA synthetase